MTIYETESLKNDVDKTKCPKSWKRYEHLDTNGI